MKLKFKTKIIALFVAILLCFAVLLSPFAVFKADAETAEIEETQQTIPAPSVQRVSNFSFCKEAMGLDKMSAKKQAEKETVVPNYEFYRYETNNAYFYVADLIEERSGLICLAIESRQNGNILHLAFYDEEEDAFTYYYESVDESFANAIKSIAIDSEESDDPNVSAIFASTRWYKHAFSQTEVEDFSIDNTLENSKQKLEQYYAAQEQAETQLAQAKESAALQLNAAGGSSTNEVFATASAAGHDDTITIIIPRELFTYAGKKTGNDGALGYFVNTYEFPEGSGRFLSEALVWSHYYSVPTYESDEAKLLTTVDFSANLEYAEDGFMTTQTPADSVHRLEDNSNLALTNITSRITVVPTSSYLLDGTYYDNDEFIYGIAGDNVGEISPDADMLTGLSASVKICDIIASVLGYVPGIPNAIGVILGTMSEALSIADNVINYSNGIDINFNASALHFESNFIADRSRHYQINGNQYVREVQMVTDPGIYFSPNNHWSFSTQNCSSQMKAWLNTEGTNLYEVKRLKFYNKVDIVDADYDWHWFQKEISGTVLRSFSMTQESYYYRSPIV